MQLCNGDDFGVSQPTVSRVIWQTLDALTAPRIFHQFVKIPLLRQEVQRKQAEFMNIARFPGVVGVIDGTHIRIVAPKDDGNQSLRPSTKTAPVTSPPVTSALVTTAPLIVNPSHYGPSNFGPPKMGAFQLLLMINMIRHPIGGGAFRIILMCRIRHRNK